MSVLVQSAMARGGGFSRPSAQSTDTMSYSNFSEKETQKRQVNWLVHQLQFALPKSSPTPELISSLLASHKALEGGFPVGSDGKESDCSAGDLSSIPGLRRSPGEGNGNPLQYFCLDNPMDRGIGQQSGGLQRVGHDLAQHEALECYYLSILPPQYRSLFIFR